MNYMDFRKKIATDKEFAAKFTDCKSPEALVETAAKEGYSFTVEDIKSNTELLPEELEKAAGGSWIVSSSWVIGSDFIVTEEAVEECKY